MGSEMGDDSFVNIISNLLKLGNTVNALNVFNDNKNLQEVYNNSWDLIPIISSYLNENNESNNLEVFKCCEKMINQMAEQSKPEDVLLQLIEEIEGASDDVKFLNLLKPIQKVFFRVPDKRITSLAWCFNAIKVYLKQLTVPENYNLTEEERLLLDCDERVMRIIHLYEELDFFCKDFIEELNKVTIASDSITERKFIMGKFMIDLLGEPLGSLNLEIYKQSQPEARTIADELVKKICKVVSDPFSYLNMRDQAEFRELFKPNTIGLGVFFYLLFSDNTSNFKIPVVYNRIHVINYMHEILVMLLINENVFLVEKGVNLTEIVFRNVEAGLLPYYLLDNMYQKKFCLSLCDIMVHNQSENLRKRCLKIFQTYLWAFDDQGRYNLILNLMKNLTHSGLKGYIITQYKEMFAKELKASSDNTLSKYYCGKKLFDLFDQFTLLKEKEKSDLVDLSDQIVSTLNFILFIFLADKSSKSCFVWYDNKLDDYFDYLEKGIKMSKKHYLSKIKEIRKGKKKEIETTVTVGSSNLFEMDDEKKIEVLQLSLTTLDVIRSLLFRVTAHLNNS